LLEAGADDGSTASLHDPFEGVQYAHIQNLRGSSPG
jgi:hypothetical protein